MHPNPNRGCGPIRSDRNRLPVTTMNDTEKDKQRIDWLEKQIKRNGAIHLHDGKNPHGFGLGLVGDRSLREAIDAALQYEN